MICRPKHLGNGCQEPHSTHHLGFYLPCFSHSGCLPLPCSTVRKFAKNFCQQDSYICKKCDRHLMKTYELLATGTGCEPPDVPLHHATDGEPPRDPGEGSGLFYPLSHPHRKKPQHLRRRTALGRVSVGQFNLQKQQEDTWSNCLAPSRTMLLTLSSNTATL